MAELNLYTVPAGAPFLDRLAQALLAGRFGPVETGDPLALARVTLYLPTRRAARAFAACLSARHGRPLLMPRIVPLGDVDEAETALIGADGWDGAAPRPIDPLARRLLLTRLVEAWGRSANRSHLRLDPSEPALVPSSLAEAYDLAGDLAALLDQMQTEGVAVERLATLDAARFDAIWRLNADFLAILGEAWPKILAERGTCDPAAFRDLMLGAERERLLAGGAQGPIIAAGSTGTIPATARLLAAIARLPQGAVVLPGLDRDLDEGAWRAIGEEPAPSHPQAALRQLLAVIGAERDEVRVLGAEPEPDRAARAAWLNEAMLPASVSERWRDLESRLPPERLAAALDGVALVEAADERGEALALAAAIRETLETPGAHAALITPDRGLAERVAVELGRWGVAVDDSAGTSLARCPAGALLRLVLEATFQDFAPAALVPLLAHPLCRLGLPDDLVRQGAAALEIGAWRGLPVEPGLAGQREALARFEANRTEPHAPLPRRRLGPADLAAAEAVLAGLAEATEALRACFADSAGGLAAFVAAARQAASNVARRADDADALFGGKDGEALALLFDDLAAAAGDMPEAGRPADHLAILEGLLAERVVRRSGGAHPRVTIWGLLEARLLQADHVLLAGLNETVWPPQADTDAFLNRPMRRELGLPQPERRIGQAAHDFVMAAAGGRVTLSRARKAGEAETIPSRFWQRLKAVTPPRGWAGAAQRGEALLRLAGRLAAPSPSPPALRPAPKPPRALQPTRLSVTEVETLYRDPYRIYAAKILRLDELPPLIEDPTASERGQLLHGIVERFARTYPEALPADPHGDLIRIAAEEFAAFRGQADVRAFWWPRFLLTARHFLAWEQARRPLLRRIAVEQRTAARFTLADGTEFHLAGRADRIEITREPALRIVDFKTGAPPSAKQIEKGFAPQLTLEAELAARAGFPPDIAALPVEAVAYVRLGHDPEHWRRAKALDFGGEPLAEVAARHLAGLIAHLDALRSGAESFVSRRAPDYIRYASPYDHLARVKEWSSAAPGAGGEAEE